MLLVDHIVVKNPLQIIDPLTIRRILVVFPQFGRDHQVYLFGMVVVELSNLAIGMDHLNHPSFVDVRRVVREQKLNLVPRVNVKVLLEDPWGLNLLIVNFDLLG